MDYLFDMDGVLVDSKEAWFRAFREVGGITRDDFEDRYWGRDLQANLDELGSGKEEMCDSVLVRHLDAVELVAGVREVLGALEGHKALVTNTTTGCTERILRDNGLDGAFHAVLTSDQVSRGKPDPALLREAMERIGASPRTTMMVGDSEEDMEAGRRAGCMTVGIGVVGDFIATSIRDLPEIASLLRRS
jgi:HAD superfamily hydrolase (TIGR01509 family)